MLASYIKALINKDGNHWRNNGTVGNKNNINGNSVTITYSFFDSRPSGFSEDAYKDFTAFSTAQKT
ncbi:MAG: protease, partial [Cyanobacteria bacterium J06626_18]